MEFLKDNSMNRGFNDLRALLQMLARLHLLPLLLLLLLTAVTYGGVLTHEFLVSWDDPGYVTQNLAIRGFSWQNLSLALTSCVAGNYAPVPIISYMLDYTLWGLSPGGFFFANILYHFLSGVLLYFIFIRQGFWKWGAALGCAVFLVHPVQVESVAWISQRKNLLAMLFYLMSFHAYLNYRTESRTTGRNWWYIASLVIFALSLLSKPVAVIFPLMLLLFELTVAPVRTSLKDHADKLPYLVVACIIGLIAIITQSMENSGGRVAYPDNALLVLPFTMLPVLVAYLRILIFPLPSALSAMYSIPTRSSIDWLVLAGLCVFAALILLGIYLYRRHRSGFFWYGIIFLGLLPVSQIIPIVTRMNDRYLYFPMLGVAGLICCLASRFTWRHQSQAIRQCAVFAAITVVIMLATASSLRARYWKDTVTLFSDMVAKAPNQFIAWDGLAEGYRAAGDMESALDCYEKASKLGYLREVESAHLARIYLERRDFDKANNHIWGLLIKSTQSGSKAGQQEGLLLLGVYYYLKGDYEEAENRLLSCLETVPDSPEALLVLGKVAFMTKQYERAKSYYSRARSSGGESSELRYAMECLKLKGTCTSPEMAAEGLRKEGKSE